MSQGGATGEGFEVQKYGDGRVALIGFPSGAPSCLYFAQQKKPSTCLLTLSAQCAAADY